MAVKLHTCPNMWIKVGGHPCHRVRAALDGAGVEYELVKGPLMRGKRDRLQELSGQRLCPVIEFEDGTVYREESANMVATIKAGNLDGKRAAAGS